MQGGRDKSLSKECNEYHTLWIYLSSHCFVLILSLYHFDIVSCATAFVDPNAPYLQGFNSNGVCIVEAST